MRELHIHCLVEYARSAGWKMTDSDAAQLRSSLDETEHEPSIAFINVIANRMGLTYEDAQQGWKLFQRMQIEKLF